MQFHFHANQSNFHKNGFALRLPLKQRNKGTLKWPIGDSLLLVCLAPYARAPRVLALPNLCEEYSWHLALYTIPRTWSIVGRFLGVLNI